MKNTATLFPFLHLPKRLHTMLPFFKRKKKNRAKILVLLGINALKPAQY